MDYHAVDIKEVLTELKTTENGLSEAEARKRLEEYGPNKIVGEQKSAPLKIFLAQFKSSIVWILIAAMIISGIADEWTDFWVISVIVVLNAIMGFAQEYKAEKAIEALKKIMSPKARVIREGKEEIINAENIVPGDLLVLETGDKISADARLIKCHNLATQEAALTGESIPVKKEVTITEKDTPVADRKNMIFAGTIITNGHAKAIVTATGMKTEIGKIAGMIHETKSPPTPLQNKLRHLSAFLAIAVIVIALVIFGYGTLIAKNPALEMLLAAIAIAVAAIPEGLPAVVTISLAMGVQRMARKNALIRKLPSAETLGACTVICSDKTGTLTHNEMTVTKLFVNRELISITGSGYNPEGVFSKNPNNFQMLLQIGALNNNAKLKHDGKRWEVIGDPTEAALLVSAKKAGIDYEAFQEKFPRINEIEFSSERKRMTTIHKYKDYSIALTKGAPEIVLRSCNRILVNGRVERLTRKEKQEILDANERLADNALRILGFAYKELRGIDAKGDIESNMIFVGLQGMIDPPRKEAKEAVKKCKEAGIKVVMITGDHKGTAVAIARELGISGKAITGQELDKIEDLADQAEEISVYARVNPTHKVKIIDALKARK
ncbi:ATPase, partial [Candidatus Woesearchaeota archaeon]